MYTKENAFPVGLPNFVCMQILKSKFGLADGSDFIVVVAEVTDDSGNVRRLAKKILCSL